MTGEITLLGRVLPIGGLKEKTMAAYRSGIKTVLIPKDNVPDLYEVESVVKENVEFVPVERIEQVLKAALVTPPGRSGKTAKTQDAKDAAGRESAKGSGASGVC